MTVDLSRLIARAVRWYGPRVAVASEQGTLTFAEVGERAARLANALSAHLPVGTPVGVLLSNRPEYIEIDLALALAGLVKAPVNPRLSDDERRFILGNVGAGALITEASERDRVADIRAGLDSLRLVVTVGETDSPAGHGYEDFLAAARTTWPDRSVDPQAPSVVLYTSGTTGRPKGATTSVAARLAAARNMVTSEYPCGPDDGMVHFAPLSHGSGSKVLIYFLRGARNVVVPRFDPATAYTAFTDLGGTSTFLVPTMIHMLLEEGGDRWRGTGLRNITYGGSPIPPSTLDRALAAFGSVFTQVYGSCEAPHPVTAMPRELHRPIDGSTDHLASAGREAMDVEVRIADDAGEPVPDGELGEILVRGPNVMSGYWGDPTATAEVFHGDWYRTGDVGRRDEAGFIYIVDRRRDMIISGGLNVYPAEVEAVLARHRLVSEVAVVGVPDERWGEVVAACVVPTDPTVTEAELAEQLTEFARDRLAGYKRPRLVRVLPELPKGSTGKVSKRDLRSALRPGQSQ